MLKAVSLHDGLSIEEHKNITKVNGMSNLVKFPITGGRSSSLRPKKVRLDVALNIVATQLLSLSVNLNDDQSEDTIEKTCDGLRKLSDYLRSLSS